MAVLSKAHVLSAGSEKRQKTGVAKDSLMEKEGTAINQSLTVLRRVCAQLGDPKRSHIAYRDDHLTRALQVRSCSCPVFGSLMMIIDLRAAQQMQA